MTLTAILLTRGSNSHENIKRAEESVEFADEVLVVREQAPITDFSEARNRAIVKARGEWVIFVDSDEEVGGKLAGEIMEKIKKTSRMNGYKVKRVDMFLGKWLRHGETGSVRLLRLARKDAGLWVRPVHEVWKVRGGVGEFSSPMLHYSHQSVDGMVEKLDGYSEIEAKYRFHKTNKLTKKQTNKKTNKSLNKNIIKIRLLMEMAIYPLGKFIQNYFLRLGFLDGIEGFIHAAMMSFHSFLVRAKQLAPNLEVNGSL